MKRFYILALVLLFTGLVRGDAPDTRTRPTDGKLKDHRAETGKLSRVCRGYAETWLTRKDSLDPAYVIYVIEGGKVRTHGVDGTVTEAEFRTGDVIYREAVTHWAENVGNTTIRLELVELKN